MNFDLAIYPVVGFGLAINYYASNGIEFDQSEIEFNSESTEHTLQFFLGVFVIEMCWFDE
jgi:hypothetical protein